MSLEVVLEKYTKKKDNNANIFLCKRAGYGTYVWVWQAGSKECMAALSTEAAQFIDDDD